MAHDVFVSYSSKDKAIADAIVASLEINNIRCWYTPRDVKPSEDWGDAITKAIEKCEIFLIVFSGNANHSQHVLDEILYAINEERIILPFRIENLDPTGAMKLHLSSRHWLDAYDPSWEAHINKLVSYVSIILQDEIQEDQVHIPQGMIDRQKQIKKKKRALIISSIVAVTLLSIGGWFGFRAFFPLLTEDVMTGTTETPTATDKKTSPIITVGNLTQTPEANAGVGSIEDEEFLQLAFSISDPIELDPQKVIAVEEKTLSENLFINLTYFDYQTYDVEPEAAESWSISPDGKTYTFIIRQDIPWVTIMDDGQTAIALDEYDSQRFVTAHDFEYAIRRLCDPEFDPSISGLPQIVGCSSAINYDGPDDIPDDEIGINAVSDRELIIELEEPSASFLMMTSEFFFSPLPTWVIEEYGNSWTDPSTIQTCGWYIISEVKSGENIILIRNPLLPEDLQGEGNIEQINIQLNIPEEDQYDLWKEGLIDFSIIPDDLVVAHKDQYPGEILTGEPINLLIFFLNMNKAPFDNVHVRRAFAATLDKDDFVQNYEAEIVFPKNDLFLSGVFEVPGYKVDSLGFDPEFAENQLAEAGYPNCVGLPTVRFNNTTSAIQIPDEIIQGWEANLGCPQNTIQVEQGDWTEQETDMVLWSFRFSLRDYHFQFREAMLSCNWSGGWRFIQYCDGSEDLIKSVEQTDSIDEKLMLLQKLDEMVFGVDGDFRVIPLDEQHTSYAVHEWLELDVPIHWYPEYYNWFIKPEIKP